MHGLERWAAGHQISAAWVGTDLARDFHQRCGWAVTEAFTTTAGQHMTVLCKRLS